MTITLLPVPKRSAARLARPPNDEHGDVRRADQGDHRNQDCVRDQCPRRGLEYGRGKRNGPNAPPLLTASTSWTEPALPPNHVTCPCQVIWQPGGTLRVVFTLPSTLSATTTAYAECVLEIVTKVPPPWNVRAHFRQSARRSDGELWAMVLTLSSE